MMYTLCMHSQISDDPPPIKTNITNYKVYES